MRNAATIIFLLMLLSVASTAGAVSDSVSTAVDIINGFYAEAESLVDTVDDLRVPFKGLTLEKKESALSDLRSIGLTKSPSRERYEQVKTLSEKYMASVIADIEWFKEGISEENASRIDDIASQLTALMSFKMKTLEDTLQIESYEKKGPKPVPLIDRERTPFDHPPDEPPGIWFR